MRLEENLPRDSTQERIVAIILVTAVAALAPYAAEAIGMFFSQPAWWESCR